MAEGEVGHEQPAPGEGGPLPALGVHSGAAYSPSSPQDTAGSQGDPGGAMQDEDGLGDNTPLQGLPTDVQLYSVAWRLPADYTNLPFKHQEHRRPHVLQKLGLAELMRRDPHSGALPEPVFVRVRRAGASAVVPHAAGRPASSAPLQLHAWFKPCVLRLPVAGCWCGVLALTC
jgi:hypothetical protein